MTDFNQVSSIQDADAQTEHSPPVMQRRDDRKFQAELDALVRRAEEVRIRFMRSYHDRKNWALALTIISITAGGAGFGWYFLMQANLIMSVLCMAAAIIPPVFLSRWSAAPINAYKKHHKKEFMPRIADALGGLKFYPNRGVSSKVLKASGIFSSFGHYEAEDCFMGRYKGVEVLMAEARIFKSEKKGEDPLFDGFLILLQADGGKFHGHTIITADEKLIESASRRWRKLKQVDVSPPPEAASLYVFSDDEERGRIIANEQLLKELSEAARIFDNAPLSASFFKDKYAFIAIPYKGDMFEASDINLPVATKRYAITCKREIEQILEVIDVFEVCNMKDNTTG